ncbi:putative serine O-acetyltransferase [Helianthus annuus]|nr:putative serine O-acetyltransferase [Helianthus annuus]
MVTRGLLGRKYRWVFKVVKMGDGLTGLSVVHTEKMSVIHLGNKLCSSTLLSTLLYDMFLNTFSVDPDLRSAAVADLRDARSRDPACVSFSHCLLNYTRFLACQVMGNGVCYWLWGMVVAVGGGDERERRERKWEFRKRRL